MPIKWTTNKVICPKMDIQKLKKGLGIESHTHHTLIIKEPKQDDQ